MQTHQSLAQSHAYASDRTMTAMRDFFAEVAPFTEYLDDEDLVSLAVYALPVPVDGSLDVTEFRDRYWAAESFSKLPFDLPGINRAERALELFRAAEVQCGRANARLCDVHGRPGVNHQAWSRARSLCHSILGSFSWDVAVEHCSFGPGATTSLRRSSADRPNKWEFGAHITRQCLPLLQAFSSFVPGWAEQGGRKVTIVAGNKVTTVPKNAKTDRVIAIEPDWNMFFQRGIGVCIRDRLRRRVALLRPDAQDYHKSLAKEGSRSGLLATLDLKMASDSVSMALCEALLPSDWLDAMYITRSPVGIVGSETVVYEKISSMGNGFTFELETLLIYCLVRAIAGLGTVSVYGDDIICPTDSAENVITFLNEAGFEVNPSKTHFQGSFRESCGGHYYAGHDVTPPYFRDDLTTETSLISAANRLSRCASQRLEGLRDARFENLWHSLTLDARFFGPEEVGDAVVHVPWDYGSRRQWDRNLFCYRFRGLLPRSTDIRRDTWGGVLASLWGHRVTEESYISKSSRVRVGTLRTNSWTGPGPWVSFTG